MALAGMVFVDVPVVPGALISTLIWQLVVLKLPPVRVIEEAPAVAVTAPPQVLVMLGVVFTVCPVGNGSVTLIPVSKGPVVGREIVMVKRDTPLISTVLGLKDLERETAR